MNTSTDQFAGHTPGPYSVLCDCVVRDLQGERLAICGGKNAEADSKLFAAAPELLAQRDRLEAALQQFIDTYDRFGIGGMGWKEYEATRAAALAALDPAKNPAQPT